MVELWPKLNHLEKGQFVYMWYRFHTFIVYSITVHASGATCACTYTPVAPAWNTLRTNRDPLWTHTHHPCPRSMVYRGPNNDTIWIACLPYGRTNTQPHIRECQTRNKGDATLAEHWINVGLTLQDRGVCQHLDAVHVRMWHVYSNCDYPLTIDRPFSQWLYVSWKRKRA